MKNKKKKGRRTKKEITAIIIVGIIILTLVSSVAGFLISSGYAAHIKRFLSDLGSSRPAKDTETDTGELGTEPPLKKTPDQLGGTAETEDSGTTTTEEVIPPDGTGILSIINSLEAPYTSQDFKSIHRSGASENYANEDRNYSTIFHPPNINAKIISQIPDYKLEVDSRPLYSTTTIYLELSLHSQSGVDITVNDVENELRVSFPRADWDFGSQTLYLQQYNPNGTSNYPNYHVKNLITAGNGVGTIELPNLNGTYESQNPYAYFRLTFE